jgi:endonuclease/exonuclease/phosphatase family metal-dependent hydrolase
MFLKRSFIGFNIFITLLYLLVCLVPLLDDGQLWFISVLGLVFPVFLFFVLIFLVTCLIKRSKWAYVPLAALLISGQQLLVVFGMRFEKRFNIEKPSGTIRVLSWNINGWDEANAQIRGGSSFRSLMQDMIQTQDADILCLQEFFECYASEACEPNIPVLEKMGYKFHYFFPSSKIYEGHYQYGLAIFSRVPIIDSAHFITDDHPHSEGLCFVDAKFQNQVIRIFTTHLESVGFSKSDYEELGNMDASRDIFGKIKRSYWLRNEQARVLAAYIKKSPYPVIVTGDLDDVPNSYAYFAVKGNLQDAFLKKGSGFGRTIRVISPTLRIDYLFADKKFKVMQYSRPKVPYSDHYPIITDLVFR